MAFDLFALTKPMTREEALRADMLVDCTLAGSWAGFRVHMAMAGDAWEEVVGYPPGLREALSDPRKVKVFSRRLHDAMGAASAAVAQHKRFNSRSPLVQFRAAAANPKPGRQFVALVMTAGRDKVFGDFLTINLDTQTP